MKIFLLRLLVFGGLWVYLIIQYSEHIALSLLFFAVVLSLYFFLSIQKIHVFVYYVLSFLMLLHGLLLTNESLITMLLIINIAMIAAFRFKNRSFLIYSLTNAVLLFILNLIHSNHLVETTVVSLWLLLMTVILNNIVQEIDEKQQMYEGLLGEYRRLKRLQLANDHHVRLEERTRIARDIHDSVGHRLTSLIMKLEMLAIQEESSKYKVLKEMAEDGLKETRKAVKALQSEEHIGIATVIDMIRKLEAESHIVIQFTIKQGVLSVELSNDNSVVLYRVLQEALTNVMRHGQTREVEMILGKSALGDVSFEVKNVHQADKPLAFGFGLTNMKERIEEIDGTLYVYQTDEYFILSGTIPGE